MRITQEACNAIRIVYYLAVQDKKLSAKQVSDGIGISLRFSLKILRKLILCGIARSYKGMKGGYMLNRRPEEISVGEIIEVIDGPINILRTLGICSEEHQNLELDRPLQNYMTRVNNNLRSELYNENLALWMIKNNISISGNPSFIGA